MKKGFLKSCAGAIWNKLRSKHTSRQQSRKITTTPLAWAAEESLLVVIAVFVGALTGGAVAGFRIAVNWIRITILGPDPVPHHISLIIIPCLAGLLAAFLLRLFPTGYGSGVNAIKEAIYVHGGRVSFGSAFGKFIASPLAIGGGHSLGPEDPSLHIGAVLGSLLGQTARLSRDKLRLMSPIGAAAGLAAAFSAPISAVTFAIEEITGSWTARMLSAGILSTSASVVVAGSILGFGPLFDIPAVVVMGQFELITWVGIGIIGGLASVLLTCAIGTLRLSLRSMPDWTRYLKSAMAGALIGVVAYLGAPQVMGVGYEVVDRTVAGQFAWSLLFLLASLKILATALSVSSGAPGGLFAPTLVIGGLLGGAVSGAEQALWPDFTSSVGVGALIGMSALFAGFMRTPITAILLAVEVSGNHSIIVPAMIASTLAYFVSRSFQRGGIFDLLAKQDGMEFPSTEQERETIVVRVEDVMCQPPQVILSGRHTVAQAIDRLKGAEDVNVLAYDPAAGWGLVSTVLLKELVCRGESDAYISSLYHAGELPQFYPDNQLSSAMCHILTWPLLPVVRRGDVTNLEGVLTLQESIRKCNAMKHKL